MKFRNKLIIPLLLAGVLSFDLFAKPGDPEPEHYKNLKVLPKNISSKDLQELMVDDFQDDLGVTCDFCHAGAKDGHGLDFASDEKPEKKIARLIMKMTLGVNKKYFKVKHPALGSSSLIITCETCHKGQPFPADANSR